jgi:hypothetical protein
MPAETVTLVTGAGGEPGRWPDAAAKAATLNLVRSERCCHHSWIRAVTSGSR